MLKWNEVMIFKLNYFPPHRVWWLYMHNSYDLPFSIEWKAVAINDDHFVVLSWKLHSFRLLEKPFKTDCIDYRLNTKHVSRKACIRDCKIKTSRKKCQVTYNTIDLYRKDPVMNFSTNYEAWCFKQIDFNKICMEECPHYDCSIDYYIPVVVHQWHTFDDRLQLNIVTEPETVFHIEPKFQTIEFICYLASTLGIWFGFSLLELYSLGNLIQKYLSKLNQLCSLARNAHNRVQIKNVQINRLTTRNNIRLN